MDSYMAMMGYRELDISHHGIKGQRWGVQNGPPYPNANKSAEWSAIDIGFEYLQHYGIKGQKWGVRRFQNADRTWTEAGKIRYGRNKSGLDSDVPKGSNTVTVKEKTIFGEKERTFDHDSNSKLPLMKYAANVALDIITLNPYYAALDTARGAQAVAGYFKGKKYSKERNTNPVDEKTGFHLKSKELSPKDDIKRINPDVNDFNTNSKSNCVLCTMTAEMRRRGYDVTANKAGYGYLDRELTRFFPNYTVKKYGSAQGLDNAKAVYGVNKNFAKDIVSKIEKDQPEGSRGNISVQWGTGGGHSMFYEIKNGKLIISDGQIGKIYSDPVKILKNCRSIDIGRLDNLEFDPNGIKEACR